MKKHFLAIGSTFLLLFLSIVPLSIGYNIKISDINEQSLNRGNTLYVGGSGPNNYTSIQDAIDDAVDGDTVFVFDDSSPYYGQINITKSINLIGEDKNTTIIIGQYNWGVIWVKVNEVNVCGFTIKYDISNPQKKYFGIYIDNYYGNTNNCNISGNIIFNTLCGIAGLNAKDEFIFNNIIHSNTNGIAIGDAYGSCYNNNIYQNIIYNCDEGISLGGSDGSISYTFIYKNIIKNNQKGISIGAGMGDAPMDNYIYSNDILYNQIGISLESGWSLFTPYPINNHIYKNNFVSNTEHNSAISGRVGLNYWDDYGNGNYWSDYTGEDNDNDGIGDTPYKIHALYGKNNDNYPSMKPYGEFDPNAPSAPIITGPTETIPRKPYDYGFVATDPNNHDLFYYISWGDGTYDEWIGPISSGATLTVSHTWSKIGNYVTTAKAMNTNGKVGPWGILPIKTPRTKALYDFNLWDLLERFKIIKEILS